jgi:hypothetical protein
MEEAQGCPAQRCSLAASSAASDGEMGGANMEGLFRGELGPQQIKRFSLICSDKKKNRVPFPY